VFIRLLLALALLPGLTPPAAAQGAAASPPPEIVKAITEVASSDAAVQETAAVALGKTGDRKNVWAGMAFALSNPRGPYDASNDNWNGRIMAHIPRYPLFRSISRAD